MLTRAAGREHDIAVRDPRTRMTQCSPQLTSTAVVIGLVSTLAVGAGAWLALPLLLSAQQPQ